MLAAALATSVAAAPAGADPTCYDDALVAVVKAFQTAHNLSVDGVIGPRATAMIDFGSSGTVRLMLIGSVPMEKL